MARIQKRNCKNSKIKNDINLHSVLKKENKIIVFKLLPLLQEKDSFKLSVFFELILDL